MYKKNLSEALKSGKVLVRKVWKNENSPGQVSFQFIQRIEIPATGITNTLLGLAQGYEDAGYNRVTAIMSFSEKSAYDTGLFPEGSDVIDFSETDEVHYAGELFGRDVAISVEENFTQNPKRPNQEPKMNPTTNEVVMLNGNPIYRHTEIVEANQVSRIFVSAKSVAVTATEAIENLETVSDNPYS